MSLYELLGTSNPTTINETELKDHVEEIFRRINPISGDYITIDDLIEYSKRVRVNYDSKIS